MAVKILTNAVREYIKHLMIDGRDLYASALSVDCGDRVMSGLMVAVPTTASTQATGATGVTAWRVNLDKGLAALNGKMYELAATTDHVIANGNVGLIAGDSMVAAVVAYLSGSTLTVGHVLGAPAVTGSQVTVSDAAITASLSTSNWVRLADCTINRTADLTVTQSQDNTVSVRGLML
jgi:hypothetical protein